MIHYNGVQYPNIYLKDQIQPLKPGQTEKQFNFQILKNQELSTLNNTKDEGEPQVEGGFT